MRRGGRRTEAVRAEKSVTVRMYHGLGEIVPGFTKNAFAVFDYSYVIAALFFALAIVFHLLPFALAVFGPRPANVIAIIAVAIIILTRVILHRDRLPPRQRPPRTPAHDRHLVLDPAPLGVFTGIRKQLHWRELRCGRDKVRLTVILRRRRRRTPICTRHVRPAGSFAVYASE
jgi:hypothetical protein